MPRMKEHPRYNVLSLRVSDNTLQCIDYARAGSSMQDYLHAALEEKLARDRERRIEKLGC